MSAKTTVIGRIGRDPELTFTNNGQALLKFSVVTSGRRLNKQTDKWEDTDTTWWNCTVWGETAEKFAENLEKGDAVVLHGTAYTDQWEDKEGNKRSSLSFRVDNGGLDLRWTKKQFRDPAPAAAYADEPGF